MALRIPPTPAWEGDGDQPPTKPARLMPAADADAHVADHVETTHFFDEETGEFYEPTSPPLDGDDDEDAEA